MRLLGLATALLLAGCVAPDGRWGNGAHWPSMQNLSDAAVHSATAPGTWVPLAGAALLMIDNQDAELTDWAAREQPLFGDRAQDRSDDLESLLVGTYVISALAAPSASASDKLKGLYVGAATVLLEGGLTKGLKRTINRERPNGNNDYSMPSGTAGRASVLATLSEENFAAMDLSPTTRRLAQGAAHAASWAAAWSRVEAGKHHASDVLVGNALGHFLATFMQEAFLQAGNRGLSVRYAPVEDGGALVITLATP